MKFFIIISLLIGVSFNSFSQKRGAVWCFGDSALVDFRDTSNILTGQSIVKSRGTSVSISDSIGNLIMYAYTRAGVNGNTTRLINNQDSLIEFGDSIVGEGWYRELIIMPYPDSSLHILFSIGVTGSSQQGFYYSIVDMSLNGGLGEVIQKNVQLENFKTVDCLTAIKHGNGRDWWVLFRRIDGPSSPNNDFYLYLVTSGGVVVQNIQSIGSQNATNSGRISFNSTGTRMSYINYKGLIELYDFDRCTGLINNPVTIEPENTQPPWSGFWSAEFSPSGNILYVTGIPAVVTDSSRLFQYDLMATNISSSKLILWSTPWMITIDQLKMAPDDKMYLTTNYYQIYPYQDTMYNNINMNLSVINSPDSLGFACDLQPFSFYLGGKRSYAGLPNNPDYDLSSLVGSPCDTLTSLNEIAPVNVAGLYVYYSPQWQTTFINADKLSGTTYRLSVYDLMGKEVFSESGKITSPYYTKNLNCTGWAKGMYVVRLECGTEKLVKKFLIE